MAQFGGTFSPAASTWGPFPVRPVSPGSANSSPKHIGGANSSSAAAARPNSAHTDHSSTTSSATSVATTNAITTIAANTSTATGSPHTPNPTPYNPQPAIPTPSSVRKQLFTPDPKLTGVITASVAAASSNGSNAVRGTGSPAHQSSTSTTAIAPQQPVGTISQPPIQPSKTESSAAPTPGKDKPALPAENQSVSVTESSNSVGFSAPAMTMSAKVEPMQQLPPPPASLPSSEAPSALLNSQLSSHLPTVPPPVLSHSVAHPNNTVPHFSAPAPRVSHRMQPTGPYYSLSEQQQHQTQQQQQPQSVFVPFSAQQEPTKQTQIQTSQPTTLPPQAQTQTQGPLQVSANLGMMNGSQMHVASTGKPQQIPANFGPAGLFNFSSIFDNNNQVGWGVLSFETGHCCQTALMCLIVLTCACLLLSSRLETIMCGVLYLCLLGHLRNSLIPHLQPIWAWVKWRVWCPRLLQTARKPQAAALPLSGWSTARLVRLSLFYFVRDLLWLKVFGASWTAACLPSQLWPALPPVSLGVLCICTVTQQLEHPRLTDSTFPLILGVHPHKVYYFSCCSLYLLNLKLFSSQQFLAKSN